MTKIFREVADLCGTGKGCFRISPYRPAIFRIIPKQEDGFKSRTHCQYSSGFRGCSLGCTPRNLTQFYKFRVMSEPAVQALIFSARFGLIGSEGEINAYRAERFQWR